MTCAMPRSIDSDHAGKRRLFFFFYGADPGVADPVKNVPRRYDMTLLTGPPPAGEARTEYLGLAWSFLGSAGKREGTWVFCSWDFGLDPFPDKRRPLPLPGVLTTGNRALISIKDAPAARQL